MSDSGWVPWDHCLLRRVYVPGGGWTLEGEDVDPNLVDYTSVHYFGFVFEDGSPRVESDYGFRNFLSMMAQLGAAGWELVNTTQYSLSVQVGDKSVLRLVETYLFKRTAGKG